MPVSNPLLFHVVRAIFPAGLIVCAGSAAALTAQEYEAALQAAREGRLMPAIEKIDQWRKAYPGSMRIAYDFVTLLSQAGQHEEALVYGRQLLDFEAPPYVIKAVAASARAVGRAQESEAAYRLLLAKTPGDPEAHAGLAYAWMGQDRTQQAIDYVVDHLPKTSSAYRHSDMPLLVALADLRERRKEWLPAATAYQEVLRFDPGFLYALRGRVFALDRAGMPHLAKRLADSRPDAFNADEKQRLAQAAAGHTVSFGKAQIAVSTNRRTRFSTTDAALAQSADLASRFGPTRTSQLDRLVALRDRVRMREAAALYESLAAENTTIPPYAKAAAADAYLYLEQPEKARDLYRDALNAASAGDKAEIPDWQIALIFAYNEAEQHDEAQALADRLLAATPATSNKGLRGVEAPNEEYSRVAVMSGLVRLYAERLEEAEQRLAELRAQAPFNSEVRAAWASLLSTREKPRAALEEFTLLQIDDPAFVEAAASRGESLLALNEFSEAKTMLPPLLADFPEDKEVQKFARKLSLYDSPHLRVETTVGRGAAVAGAESVLDAALYSAPLTGSLGDGYRVFAHWSRSQGRADLPPPPNGAADAETVSRNRAGAGLNYRSRFVTAEAEANRAMNSAEKSGAALGVGWTPSDAWQGRIALDTNVNDLPAAAFRNGVTAKALKLNLSWALHESHKIGADLSRTRFSDSNVRDEARLWWTERWVSGPVFKLATTLAFYGSQNSEGERVYFNPKSDRQADLTVTGEWQSSRRYERWFKQRVALTGGRYRQDGFRREAAGDLRYEHEWNRDEELSLRYGIGHSFHPYNGVRESRNYGYLSLNWNIK
ncbi:MAG: biofilm synthesis protein PgaA [Burkholderiales bacterium]|jgi:biofilm PGA synthesis protein PgaA